MQCAINNHLASGAASNSKKYIIFVQSGNNLREIVYPHCSEARKRDSGKTSAASAALIEQYTEFFQAAHSRRQKGQQYEQRTHQIVICRRQQAREWQF